MNTESQCLLVQRHLAKGHSLTKLEALRRWGVWNLGGRIFDLRKRWKIRTEIVKTRSGKRIASYTLPEACK